MYIPRHNQVHDQAVMHHFMARFSFAPLISVENGVPVATHLPFMLNPQQGEHGTLIAHMARANSQWKTFAPDQEVLVIFQGHHAYISPSWYEGHPNVPTWNYMVVHAYGLPRLIDDPAEMTSILKALVDTNESGFEAPWQMHLPDDYMQRQLKAIVAFEIQITRLEGKFKISQNRSEADQAHVIDALAHSSDPIEQALSQVMREQLG